MMLMMLACGFVALPMHLRGFGASRKERFAKGPRAATGLSSEMDPKLC